MPQSVPSINGTPGSNDNLPLNTLVQLNNVNSGGETSYLWQLVSQPAGSAVSLSNTAIANPTFTPTKEGSYRLTLTVNGTLTSSIVAAVLELKSLQRIPAAGETTEVSASGGWSPAIDSLLLSLLNSQANPVLLVGEASSGGLNAGTPIIIIGEATIKAGLPGEETVPSFGAIDAAPESQPMIVADQIYLSLGGVDGDTTPDSGDLINARLYGLFTSSLGGTARDKVYISDAGALSLTAGSIARQVGHTLTDGPNALIWFDGSQVSSAAYDLADSDGNVDVSDGTDVRLANNAGKLQVSEAGGAFVDVIGSGAAADEPFLTNGPAAGLTNATDIQDLSAALDFICTASGGRVNIKRFDAGDTGVKYAIQNESGTDLAFINGDGSLTVVGLTLSGTSGIQLSGGSITGVGSLVLQTQKGIFQTQGIDVASVNDLTVPLGADSLAAGNIFTVTGTTQINRISSTGFSQNGNTITLFFAGALTVKHNQASGGGFLQILLAGNIDLTTSAGLALTLSVANVSGVACWREISRTVVNPTYDNVTLTNQPNLTVTNQLTGAKLSITTDSASMAGFTNAGRSRNAQGADVASTPAMALPSAGNLFAVTGTSTINTISNLSWTNGCQVTLLFVSTATLKHNQASSGTDIKCLLVGGDFVATAGDTITLALSTDGTTQAWREISRAVI